MKNTALVSIFALLSFALLAKPAQADWLINDIGVISQISNVMGKSDSASSSQNGTMNQGVNAPESAIQLRTQTKTMDQSQYQLEQSGDKLMIQQKTMDQKGNTVRTKTMEMNQGESLRIEQKNGSIMEIKQGQATAPGQAKKMEVMKDQVRTRTNLPISINKNNELVVTRPDGTTKTVTILPDQAVANLTAKGIVISGDTSPELIINESGVPVYQTQATQEKKILGLFRARYAKKIEVSAETGDVTTTNLETNPLKLLLEKLSF